MTPETRPATDSDKPAIRNLALLYAYDMSHLLPETGLFALPDSGLWDDPFDHFDSYWSDPARRAYVIRAAGELAGFVMVNRETLGTGADWNMAEFFVVRRFQGRGVAEAAARHVFAELPGRWSIMVMRGNDRAAAFWRKLGGDLDPTHHTECVLGETAGKYCGNLLLGITTS
jgi:predicted acetyltransferase